jgi:energy-coupling factor transporter ATP-binding protein EcfA2
MIVVEDLKIYFPIRKGIFKRVVDQVKAVDGINLSLYAGRTMALVGESGSGKSVLSFALLGLSDKAARITAGQALFDGFSLIGAKESDLADLRGAFDAGAWRFEGGGSYARGGIFGTESSGWLNVDVPVGGGFWLVTGVERFTWQGNSPYLAALGLSSANSPWRYTLGLRQRFSLPLAFLRAPGLPPSSTPAR